MKTHEIERIAETLGGNLGVLILAGGEPFTRKDLPEMSARSTEQQARIDLHDVERQIQKRIFPDVTRILEECPNLNVTVALGIDGLKEEHEKIRQKARVVGHRDRNRAPAQAIKKRVSRGSTCRPAPAS